VHVLPSILAGRHAKDSAAAIGLGMAPTIAADLRWIDETLAASSTDELYIAGPHLTIADIQLAWSVQVVFKFKLGFKETAEFPHIERWLQQLSARPAYIAACADGFHDGLAWPPLKQ